VAPTTWSTKRNRHICIYVYIYTYVCLNHYHYCMVYRTLEVAVNIIMYKCKILYLPKLEIWTPAPGIDDCYTFSAPHTDRILASRWGKNACCLRTRFFDSQPTNRSIHHRHHQHLHRPRISHHHHYHHSTTNSINRLVIANNMSSPT